jgi:hypothetical protein
VFARTPPFEYRGHLRAWLSCAQHDPTIAHRRIYFEMEKKSVDFPGQLWMRIEEPYVLHTRGALHAREFSLWHGDALSTATRVEMPCGSPNQGEAFVMNSPGVARGFSNVSLSRGLSACRCSSTEIGGTSKAIHASIDVSSCIT